jgi:hypothetical protein
VLTVFESWLYIAHIIPATALPWITDLVPTLIIIGKVAHLRSRPAMLTAPHH